MNDVCVYGVGDLQWLTQQQHLFARKFDISFDHVVYYCLDKLIQQTVHNESMTNA